MNKQFVAMAVANGLAAQMWEQSADHRGLCQYDAGADSLSRRCAAGHLMWGQDIPNNQVYAVVQFTSSKIPLCLARNDLGANLMANGLDDTHAEIVSQFQNAHDLSVGRRDMRERIKAVFMLHALTWPEYLDNPLLLEDK